MKIFPLVQKIHVSLKWVGYPFSYFGSAKPRVNSQVQCLYLQCSSIWGKTLVIFRVMEFLSINYLRTETQIEYSAFPIFLGVVQFLRILPNHLSDHKFMK